MYFLYKTVRGLRPKKLLLFLVEHPTFCSILIFHLIYCIFYAFSIYKPTEYYQQSVCSICDNSNLFDDTGDFPTFLEKQNPVHL